ncbi:threonine/serine exporter family protein [Dysgonomonas massiliensis]|uniref:threonine/serine exporter family protein n=1 Tax=Dysgonomonas massiliensis TaxID=2040292 RepID=UPI000C770530|nr:threonine/serine exporter family protein [Dysgonomonas massiliensis]
MELTFVNVLIDFSIAFIVAVGWGILFGSPRRLLLVAGLLGGLGHSIRFVFVQLDMGLITATLVGSVIVGLTGIWVSKIVKSPPVVFTMPACITMIPGLYAYRTMMSGIRLIDLKGAENDPSVLIEMSHNLMLTMSLLFTLAIGICIGALLFRKSTVRDIKLKTIIKG